MTHWKAAGLDLSQILHAAGRRRSPQSRRRVRAQDHGLDAVARRSSSSRGRRDALERKQPVELHFPIRNVNRTVGTMLGYEITRRYGGAGAARRHDPPAVHRLGRPELRRVRAARHHADARRRRERLRRQGPVGRHADRLSAARGDVRGRGEHHHRQRRALRRDQRRGVHPRHRRRALRRPQQRRAWRSSKASAITAAST